MHQAGAPQQCGGSVFLCPFMENHSDDVTFAMPDVL